MFMVSRFSPKVRIQVMHSEGAVIPHIFLPYLSCVYFSTLWEPLPQTNWPSARHRPRQQPNISDVLMHVLGALDMMPVAVQLGCFSPGWGFGYTYLGYVGIMEEKNGNCYLGFRA